MSVDGKGVVMRIQDLREQTRKAAMKRKHKMGARLSKGEKRNAKRMATVAAVYTVEPFVRKPEDLVPQKDAVRVEQPRPRPEQKRVWASLEKTPEEVIEKAFEEATLPEACAAAPHCEILAPQIANLWMSAQITSSPTNPTSSTTIALPRGFPLPRESLKAPAATWSKTALR